MTDTSADWSANSNDAITISLVVPGEESSKAVASFNPKFTYPIFGDEESIFGYQGLKVHLRYHANDMRPNLQITYDKKFKQHGEVTATDIKGVLEDYLPAAAFEKSSVFETNIKSDLNDHWKPPGELHQEFHENGENLEIWKSSLADKAVQQVMKRIQIMVPFFIEGGTFIDLDDDKYSLQRWTVFFMYKKNNQAPKGTSPYTFVGYSTVYRYYMLQLPTPPTSPASSAPDFQLPFPDSSVSDTPCRSRISQFLILPSSQGGGHGSKLYESIFQHYLKDPHTVEITVEDPNEAFDDLRDYNDLSRLQSASEFTQLRLDTSITTRSKGPVPQTAKMINTNIDTLRLKQKIAPRQFSRLVEMQLLSLVPTSIRQSLIHEQKTGPATETKKKEHEYHLWKLFVKQRLYRHNKQALLQLDRTERIDKLEDALSSVEADYARLLRAVDHKRNGSQEANGGGSLKRRSEALNDEGGPSSNKKARVENDE